MKSLFSLLIIFCLVSPGIQAQEISCKTPGDLMSSQINGADFKRICDHLVKTDPACQRVKPEKRLNCEGGQSSNRIFSSEKVLPKIVSCLKGFIWDSLKELVSMAMDAISSLVRARMNSTKTMYKFLTDENFRLKTLADLNKNTTKQSKMIVSFLEMSVAYFSREFSKNITEKPWDPVAAFGKTLFTPLVHLISQAVEGVAQHYIAEYECLNGDAKVNTICQAAGTILMPPVAIFAFLKFGKAGLKAMEAGKAGKMSISNLKNSFAKVNYVVSDKIPPEMRESFEKVLDAIRTRKAQDKETLKAASTLNDEARIEAGAFVKGRALTKEEADAIRAAHDVGLKEGRGYKIDTEKNVYTQKDINQKARFLREAGFSPEETRILMENGIVGGFAKGDISEDALRLAVDTKFDATVLGNRLSSLSKSEDKAVLLKEFSETQAKAGEAYRTAARVENDPSLMKASWESHLKAGDGKKAYEVYLQGITDFKMTPEATLRGMAQEMKKMEARLALGPDDVLFKQELSALKEAQKLMKEKYSSPVVSSPRPMKVEVKETAKPVEVAPQPVTPVKVASPTKAAKDMTPLEARDKATELRLANRPEEASQYALRASSGKNTFNDRYFHEAIDQSIRGEGTVALKVMQELQAKGGKELNEFVADMYELGLHRSYSKTETHKANIHRVLEELKKHPQNQRGLYMVQERMLDEMWRWTKD